MFPERTTPELRVGVPATKEVEEIRKKRYMEGVRKMEAAVEAGEVSKEAANKRLSEMRMRMFPERATPELKIGVRLPTKAPQETRKKEYMAAEEKIQAMVKAGKISKEDADKRLIELHTAKVELVRLRTRYTDKHPKIRAQMKVIEELERQFAGSGGERSKPAQ